MSKRPPSPTPIKLPPMSLDNLESEPTEGTGGNISPVQAKNICIDVAAADGPKTLTTDLANLTEGSLLAHDGSLREPSVHEGSPTPPAKEKPVFEPVPAINEKSDGVAPASQNLSPPTNVLSATHNLSLSSHQGMVTYLPQ